MSRFDTVILNGQVVLSTGVVGCGIGLRDGRIAALDVDLGSGDGDEVIDAQNCYVFPGGVDAHYHLGIFRPLQDDAESETESSLVGGVTSILSYFRTGSHYFNKTGSYREIYPEVLSAVEGRSHTDYGFHLAPMTSEHIDEIEWLATDAGVVSFKYYMFYKGLDLAANSTDAQAFTMSDNYDFGHLYALMQRVGEVDKTMADTRASVSLHCENAELITYFIEQLRAEQIPPLEMYSRARPPLTERLSIHEAGVLADAARVRVNLLHLSSEEALRAASQIRGLYPDLDVRAETTLHHLCLTYDQLENKGLGGKVNPPIRTRADVEALWEGVRSGQIDWVASDHACCNEELKGDELWPVLPGFGGTALLYPVMISEGIHRHGLSPSRVADLVAGAPARAYGLAPRKGAIALGADADFAVIDMDKEQRVTPDVLHSAHDHTPFEGVSLRGWPVRTILRGQTVFADDKVAEPTGSYLHRPVR